MKATNLFSMSWVMVLAMMVIASFTACTEDDEQETVPVFPTEQQIACNSGETKSLTFDANMDWILTSSNVTWCKFLQGEEEKESLSGNAGKQTVTIKATADGQTVEVASTSKLELSMGGQKATIATVTRSALGYELKIYDMEGNEIQALEIGYREYVQFQVEATYRYALSGCPDWIEIEGGSLVGTPGVKVTGGLQIVENDDREKYPIEVSNDADYMITFSDEAGKGVKSFPVYYKGMGTDDIEVVDAPSNRFNWTVSLDGTQFVQEDVSGTGNTTTQSSMEFTVKALNDEYEIVFIEQGNDGKLYLMEPSVDEWMKCEKNGGNVTLKIDAFTPIPSYMESRAGYVIAFPKATYEALGKDVEEREASLIDKSGTDIKNEYQQPNYLLIQFIQKDVNTSNAGFKVNESLSYNSIEVEKVTDPTVIAQFGGFTEIYAMQGNSGEKYMITPLIDNFADIMNYTNITDMSGNPVEITTEPGMTSDEKMYLQLDYASANITEDIAIMICDQDYSTQMILIIRAGENGGEESKNIFSTMFGGGTGDVSIVPYDGTGLTSLINSENIDTENIFKVTVQASSMLNIASTTSAINGIVCYDKNNLTTALTEQDLTGEYGLDLEFDVYSSTIYVYPGNNSVIPQETCIVVTLEDNTKYLLYIVR